MCFGSYLFPHLVKETASVFLINTAYKGRSLNNILKMIFSEGTEFWIFRHHIIDNTMVNITQAMVVNFNINGIIAKYKLINI